MTENELLLAISKIVQTQIEPLKKEIHDTNLLIESKVIPRVQKIESCYTSTFRRYSGTVNDIDQMDMDVVKKVV